MLGYTAADGKEAGPEQPTISSTATAILTNLLTDTKRDGPATNAPSHAVLSLFPLILIPPLIWVPSESAEGTKVVKHYSHFL